MDSACGDRAAAARARPYVLLNMVSTVDGRATLGGRSGPLSDRADRSCSTGCARPWTP